MVWLEAEACVLSAIHLMGASSTSGCDSTSFLRSSKKSLGGITKHTHRSRDIHCYLWLTTRTSSLISVCIVS